ncbi:hypothetical protein CPB97_005890 [Podila verticillata]|nr:hypothetical protein CPB97_005890 [Podila verticillata]
MRSGTQHRLHYWIVDKGIHRYENAATVGELVAEGKMDWDTTPVNTYLPEFEMIDPVLTSQVTMQDLHHHRTV